MEISQLTALTDAQLEALVELLCDSVNHGSSVGFMAPLDTDEARSYWLEVRAAVERGSRLLWVAQDDGAGLTGTALTGTGLTGTVQLVLEPRANQRHRAEVSKLLVHSTARRRGIARALMNALELEARRIGRSTLVLDTRAGDSSEALYQSLGYTLVGQIPEFCQNADGTLEATAVYYKLVGL